MIKVEQTITEDGRKKLGASGYQVHIIDKEQEYKTLTEILEKQELPDESCCR